MAIAAHICNRGKALRLCEHAVHWPVHGVVRNVNKRNLPILVELGKYCAAVSHRVATPQSKETQEPQQNSGDLACVGNGDVIRSHGCSEDPGGIVLDGDHSIRVVHQVTVTRCMVIQVVLFHAHSESVNTTYLHRHKHNLQHHAGVGLQSSKTVVKEFYKFIRIQQLMVVRLHIVQYSLNRVAGWVVADRTLHFSCH